jgi:hypothetical protein
MPMAEMNEAVLQAVEEHALTPEAIEQVILLTQRDDVQDATAALNERTWRSASHVSWTPLPQVAR